MSCSRTSRRCNSGLAADNGGAKTTTLLGLRYTYIDTKVVKDAELLFTFRKSETLDFSCLASASASANTLCYSLSTLAGGI